MKYLMLVADDPEADPNDTGEGTLDIDTWVSSNQAAGRWMTGIGCGRPRMPPPYAAHPPKGRTR